MYRVFKSKRFIKSYRRLKRSGHLKVQARRTLEEILTALANGVHLTRAATDHRLQGEYAAYRECHIQGNLLLVYRIDESLGVIVLHDIGTHSQLFG